MKVRKTHVSAIALLPLLLLHCGSLVGESERIRRLYEYKNGATPSVTATDPADNTIAAYNQTYIDITFSTEIDPATFTPQASFGACTGSMQVSYDGFVNCIGGTVDASQNPRLRFIPTIFPKALGFQIRVTSAVLSTVGVPALPYTSPVGFKLGAPCGNQNCFFSYSTPLMAAGSYGMFRIRTGIHAGKVLVLSTGTTTTLVDPAAGLSTSGPNLCGAPVAATLNFYSPVINSSPYSGNQIVLLGGTGTCAYRPDQNDFVAGPALGFSIGDGAHAFRPETGGETNNTFIVRGGGNTELLKYDATTGNISQVADLGAGHGQGSHHLRYLDGGNGKFIIFRGNGSPAASIFDEGTSGLSATGDLALDPLNRAASFFVTAPTALAGNLLMVRGVGSQNILQRNLTSQTNGAYADIGAAPGTGTLLLTESGNISASEPLLIQGNNNLSTLRFDSSTGTFVNGPMTTGAMGNDSSKVFVPGAQGGGGFLIANGLGSTNTSVYLPHNNSFHGSRMPTSVPNSGAHAVQITEGGYRGRTLIIGGNNTDETAIFDPITHQMSRGAQLTGTATTSAISMPITAGPNPGRIVVFFGGGTANYNVYNPATNTFSGPASLPGLGQVRGQGAVQFPITDTTKILIVRGGSSTAAEIFDQADDSVVGIPVGLAVTGGPLALRYVQPSTGHVKHLVALTGSTFRIFNHNSQSFVTTFDATIPMAAGMNGFTIPSGAHAGKVIFLAGGGGTQIQMMHNDTETLDTPLPTFSGCTPTLGAGSQVLPITTGVNAGKILVIFGGNSRSSCLYEPANHRFVPGPDVGNVSSAGFQITTGSVAFRTGGGVYPTSFVVVSGALKNVWSTYVP